MDGAASDEELEPDEEECSKVDDQSEQTSPAVNTQLSEESSPAQDRLRFNVSGLVFEVSESALHEHPTTVLGNPAKRAQYWSNTVLGNPAKRAQYWVKHCPRQPWQAGSVLGPTRSSATLPRGLSTESNTVLGNPAKRAQYWVKHGP